MTEGTGRMRSPCFTCAGQGSLANAGFYGPATCNVCKGQGFIEVVVGVDLGVGHETSVTMAIDPGTGHAHVIESRRVERVPNAELFTNMPEHPVEQTWADLSGPLTPEMLQDAKKAVDEESRRYQREGDRPVVVPVGVWRGAVEHDKQLMAARERQAEREEMAKLADDLMEGMNLIGKSAEPLTLERFKALVTEAKAHEGARKIEPVWPTPRTAREGRFGDGSRSRWGTLCAVCARPAYDDFMLHDEVWSPLFNKRDVAHLECVEQRLGRPLTYEDFTEAKINHGILWALARERQP